MSLRNGNWLAGVLSATALALSGCAMGSANNNNSQGAHATNTQSVDWRLNLSATVGDAAAQAVADTVKGLMSPAAGAAALLTPEKKEEVVQKAVEAGVTKAKEAGEVTETKKTAIEVAARAAVEEESKKSESPPPANP